MRRFFTTLLLALGLCAPVRAAGLVEIALAGSVFSYSDVAFVGATGGGQYDALLAALDASNPTLEYNAMREFVAGNYADGDPVTSATEWVSGTYPATQGTASAQPTFIESANGGHPAFRFDGGDWLKASGFTFSQPNFILVVAKYTDADTASRKITDGATATGRHLIYTVSGNWTIFSGSVVTGGADDANTHVFSCLFNGASSNLDIDGASFLSGNAGSQSLEGTTIGADYLNTGQFTGDIQIGPIIWDTPPSAAQIDAIEAELEALGYVTLP